MKYISERGDCMCPVLEPRNESIPGAMVCAMRRVVAGCTSADIQSPVWLQLRTGYILSSGSLSTVPKRESDDYSFAVHETCEEKRKEKEW